MVARTCCQSQWHQPWWKTFDYKLDWPEIPMYEEVDRQTIEAWMKEKTQQKKAAQKEMDSGTGGIQGQSRHMHKEANKIMYLICTAVVVIWSALVKQFVCEVLGPSSRPKLAEGPSPSSSPMQLHMNKKNISCRCSHGACCNTFHAGVSAGPYMAISHVWLCSMCVCMVMHWCFTCCIVLP